jgi:hypothetical protein
MADRPCDGDPDGCLHEAMHRIGPDIIAAIQHHHIAHEACDPGAVCSLQEMGITIATAFLPRWSKGWRVRKK